MLTVFESILLLASMGCCVSVLDLDFTFAVSTNYSAATAVYVVQKLLSFFSLEPSASHF